MKSSQKKELLILLNGYNAMSNKIRKKRVKTKEELLFMQINSTLIYVSEMLFNMMRDEDVDKRS